MDAVIKCLGAHQNFCRIKVHMMSHYGDCIWRSGVPFEYSTNLYESLHLLLMKVGYRASNRRNAIPQVIDHHRTLCAVRKLAGIMEDDDQEDDAGEEAVVTRQRSALKRVSMRLGSRALTRFHSHLLNRQCYQEAKDSRRETRLC